MRAIASLSLALVTACAPPVQRAVLTDPSAPSGAMARARAGAGGLPGTNAAAAEAKPAPDGEDDEAWIVTPADSRVELQARTVFVDARFAFRRFRARVVGREESPRFHADIEVASLEGGGPGMAGFAKAHLLDVALYPTASFDGIARRVGPDGACVIDGRLRLHGVERALRFDGTVHDVADGLHVRAVFDLSREPFHIGLPGIADALLPDTIRVTLDLHARRERVNVEVAP
jgi:polyisoprenoid-binding protein YceI